MSVTETGGNPTITHGDDDEWVAATLIRIEGHLAAFGKQLDHVDEVAHEIQRAVQPLIDHPEAVAKGLSLLDPGAGVRKFLTGKKAGKG